MNEKIKPLSDRKISNTQTKATILLVLTQDKQYRDFKVLSI